VRPLVFVYGTLMRGHANHRLLAGAECLGPHITAPAFTMLHMGGYPGAMAGGRTALHGEVYRIGPATLARIDRLEDCPRLYTRARVPTPFGPAWIYLLRERPSRIRRIRGGRWTG
jgi:gamma-glutamylcyclotransferase (GGCT)/AIG2-like uncharacterized protein YtfP